MNEQLAVQLFEYIRRRAEFEGVAFELPLELFEFAATHTAKVFGVSHDGRQMLFDEQEPYPGYFSAMKEKLLVKN